MRHGVDERSQRAVSRTSEEPRFRGLFKELVAVGYQNSVPAVGVPVETAIYGGDRPPKLRDGWRQVSLQYGFYARSGVLGHWSDRLFEDVLHHSNR